MKNILITQQDGSSKDPNDIFSKLFIEQMKKEQMTTSYRAMSGTQSTLLNNCPKSGIWQMVHGSHTVGSYIYRCEFDGWQTKKRCLCEQATFFSDAHLFKGKLLSFQETSSIMCQFIFRRGETYSEVGGWNF